MRIHYLAQSAIVSDSANSVHVMKMCQAFAANGHEVTLSALAGTADVETAFRYYGLETRFPLIRHDEHGHRLAGRLWRLRRAVPWLRVGSIPSMLFGRSEIAPLLRRSRPDLVYARNLAWLASICAEHAFVAESHAPPKNRLEVIVERRLYQRPGFRRLVVISHQLKAIYLSIFPWLADRIVVAHDGADDPNPTAWSRPKQAGFHVGYVGHLYPGRGAEIVVAAASKLPQVTFHIVGGTQEDCARIQHWHPPENLILHGHQPHGRLAQYYARFDVVLAPYQGCVAVSGGTGDISGYMSPLKAFEYMSWGKPILCSDLPVLREVLKNGWNALLLPSDNPDAWVAALRRLINEPVERARLGDAARADFLANYSWRKRASLVLDGLGTGEHKPRSPYGGTYTDSTRNAVMPANSVRSRTNDADQTGPLPTSR